VSRVNRLSTDKVTEEIMKHEVEILRESENVCLSPALVNGIVAAYQIAITKALGAGANALSQMLLQELGELLSEYVEQVVGGVDFTKPEEAISKVFAELKLADEVKVKREGDEWHVEIKGSVFKPTYEILRERGVKFFTLSPEALIVASIIRKYLRIKGNGNERVSVKAEVPEGDTLVFKVKEVKALR